ncbi:hypothetical protein Aazo_2136 ['Nostoc azollae' 0708]|jgi:hypothetical protein|uniref:Uncharacterized protein n=1 Tax=Nostoc azollae (strain 0708) TaxID=551115 RepID=D7DWY4_NOSA0|nr:hypothetical protein Aazo_2136 ['Nostoc azollae' 0708]
MYLTFHDISGVHLDCMIEIIDTLLPKGVRVSVSLERRFLVQLKLGLGLDII